MGLDITAYRKLSPEPSATEDNETIVQLSRALVDWTEKEFPGRTQGVVAGMYSFAERFGFRAGSYSGYNRWREWLAKVAGLEAPKLIWESESPSGPFVELINFADNEGIIGPLVSAKLAKDFAEHEERIASLASDEQSFDPYNLEKYRAWRKAFEMAADGGAVEFH